MDTKVTYLTKQLLGCLALAASMLPAFGQTAAQRAGYANEINTEPRITLETTHDSGMIDNAFAKTEIVDSAKGLQAARSAYGTAPGGFTWLDPRVLNCMNQMAKTYGYTYRVTEIAGGSHSSGSRHYSGRAVDIGTINGLQVNSSNPHWPVFLNTMGSVYGADERLGPGDAGHDTHIHAGWTSNGGNVAPFSAAQITASANTATGLPQYAGDGVVDQTQYWAADGVGQWIKFDMGSVKTLYHVKIAWFSGDVRRETFSVQVSTDNVNWTNVLTNVQSSGTTLWLETWDFPDVSARYIKVIGNGNTVNTFNSMTEFVAWIAPPPTEQKLSFSAITASASTPTGPASYAGDGEVNQTKYWAADGSGQWIKFDLGSSKTLAYVKIAWYNGNVRRETFSVDLSTDNVNWTTVFNHVQSSGTTLGYETWDFPNTSARYIRVTGYGNTVNTFNSMTELEAWSPVP